LYSEAAYSCNRDEKREDGESKRWIVEVVVTMQSAASSDNDHHATGNTKSSSSFNPPPVTVPEPITYVALIYYILKFM
jgi:hypothetical protein